MVNVNIFKDDCGVTLRFDDQYECDISLPAFHELAERLSKAAEQDKPYAAGFILDPEDEVD